MTYRLSLDKIDDYHAFYIRGMGEKASSARLGVLRALSGMDKPSSLKQICGKMNGHDESSVQRALDALLKIKLIKRILLDPKKNLYEINLDRRHHHHIVCDSCGFMEDIELSKKKEKCSPLPENKIPKSFASITDHSLEFFGICRTCVKK